MNLRGVNQYFTVYLPHDLQYSSIPVPHWIFNLVYKHIATSNVEDFYANYRLNSSYVGHLDPNAPVGKHSASHTVY
jgi:hypothetical protein